MDNLEQVGVKGGGSHPGDVLGANQWDGNYWSDYVGYDADEDGVGDLPHQAHELFESLADRHPSLRLYTFSPIEQAVNLAAEVFPIIRPKPKLTDDRPLMAPVLPLASLPNATRVSSTGWLSAGLLLAAAVLLGSQTRLVRPRSLRTQQEIPHSDLRTWRREVLSDSGAAGEFEWRQGGSPMKAEDGPLPMALAAPLHIDTRSYAAIDVQNLTKTYPRSGRPWWSDATITALDNLSFHMEAGQPVALWGTNGAGKTTVLKCLLGLLSYQGELRVNGLDLRQEGQAARRRLGYVPQELSFHDDLSVEETCRFYARLKRVERGRIPAVLDQVGLSAQCAKRVGALSGGMKQRLALALALLADPPLLLQDEPTSNLDAASRDDFLELLVRLHRLGKTVLFTSHYLDEVVLLADRVLVLDDGRLAASGRPAELMPAMVPGWPDWQRWRQEPAEPAPEGSRSRDGTGRKTPAEACSPELEVDVC